MRNLNVKEAENINGGNWASGLGKIMAGVGLVAAGVTAAAVPGAGVAVLVPVFAGQGATIWGIVDAITGK